MDPRTFPTKGNLMLAKNSLALAKQGYDLMDRKRNILIRELMDLIGARSLNDSAPLDAEITCGYTCDLLSWVLAHGKQGMAWCTVQTHVNVIAVAVLMEMACVILVEGVEAEPASLKKAQEEDMPVLATGKTAYEVSVLMGQAGVLPPAE